MKDISRQTNILLESGTNEIEIMEFTIDKEIFGINVAKVREIMKCMEVKPMQNANPYVEGVFKPRKDVITVIDLAKYLGLGESEYPERDIFMITEFNKHVYAFHVHTVEGIDRISWEKIQKPDAAIYGGEDGAATGLAEFDDKLITILDFEKIIAEIAPSTSIQVSDVEQLGERIDRNIPILIAEDSMLLARMILESLGSAGFTNIVRTDNGKEAWEYLEEAKAAGDPIENHVACIISDIEMPQMDGHRLTKLIKEDPILKEIPVILFSSLINDEMRKKGLQLGADEQISKPEIAKLVRVIDRLTSKTE